MAEIAFLLGDVGLARNDNHIRLPRAFAAAGWAVTNLDQECVRLTPAGVRLGERNPQTLDLVWLLGMGRASTFFDRMQLLRGVPQTRFVTAVDAFFHLHAKYAWWRHMPETHASGDAGYLTSVLRRGGEWVLKPAAGSYGRDVRRLTPGPAGEEAIAEATAGGDAYWLLQRFVPAIEHGEKRTLVAGGRLIGSYLRSPQVDLRANLAAGGAASPTELSVAEHALVTRVAAELTQAGVGYAAVDVAGGHLMEVNLVNPGGLGTLAELYGHDPGPAVVRAIEAAFPPRV
ncbi:MAG: ATP-grasp domain-containing protein [Pseudomonadota bacterium]